MEQEKLYRLYSKIRDEYLHKTHEVRLRNGQSGVAFVTAVYINSGRILMNARLESINGIKTNFKDERVVLASFVAGLYLPIISTYSFELPDESPTKKQKRRHERDTQYIKL